jgi:hypothetical protein
MKAELKGADVNDTLLVQYYSPRGEPGAKAFLVYNELGQLTNVWNIRKDGTPDVSYSLVYNDKGFNSEVTLFDKDKNVTSQQSASYEYDERGNWIKVICKDKKGFTLIGERVYTYFK